MSELSDAINEMRNMRESYDQLAATADIYQQGRTALASAITAKGVPTTADTPLADMAENIGDIQQVTTVIDGGDMYAAQLFGDGVLWNLYEVLAQMKSQYMGAGQYAALIVCEYYKSEGGRSYASLQLQGADAYYTCDGDFYDTAMPLHTWHDMDNGRANRWVCFLYTTAGANFDITNTAISPRSMYIGGHIGTITYFVNGRLTELVAGVEDTDYIDTLKSGDGISSFFTQSFLFNTIINGVKNLRTVDFANGGCVILGHDAHITGGWDNWSIRVRYANYLVILGDNAEGLLVDNNTSLYTIYAPNAKNFYAKCDNNGSTPTIIYTPNAMTFRIFGKCRNLIDVWVGEISQNTSVDSWYPINVLADATKKAQLIENIKNHILARVSDRTGLSQLTFTISANMFNNIASEQIEWQGETMSLADAFLTKNWLLAGA